MIYQEESGREYHIKTEKNEIGKYVILPGDPKRRSQLIWMMQSWLRIIGNS